MEGRGNPPLTSTEAVIKKPRSVASRKPRSTEQLASEYNGMCAPSRNIFHDDDAGVEAGGHQRKELYLNSPEMKGSVAHKNDVSRKLRKEDRSGGDYDGHSRSRKSKEAAQHGGGGVLALECTTGGPGSPDNPRLVPRDASVPGENRLRKVKLKVGGITRTIHTKTVPEAGGSDIPAMLDGSSYRHKHKDSGGYTTKGTHGSHVEEKPGNRHDISPSSDTVRKSKRIPKKKTLDGDSDDEDGELRYLEKLRGAKVAPDPMTTGLGVYDDSTDDALKKKKLSKVSKNKSTPYEVDEDFTMSRFGKDGRKKLQLGDDNESVEEEESEMDENNGLKELDSPSDAKIETPGLTTRQRALQGRGGHGENLIEFPDGLPTASSRSKFLVLVLSFLLAFNISAWDTDNAIIDYVTEQKEKLSEVEIQAKKAEAAQRRKMQLEKAEKEQQAEAMRKILGIDSEKKKEEKKLKEREEKEKQAKLEEYRKNCIQTVMGPTGTVITFPESMGLPSIFNSKPVSYPPPREKCAGPNCTNPFKYRHSKTMVPLCSLACYRAVQGHPVQESGTGQGSSSAKGSAAPQGDVAAKGSEAAQGSAAAQGSDAA
ncbi:hypothetical protein HU200_013016 [Digitaria exilis]|uniref:INO80 complex subunit B-like conserved region domain-containing protein n=1 Tax=Digitaria exilis TaxID=1010633 RepID=A0A835FE07_9POAL|nr:hypothetical protein HU200_013016 [Digitaria exilis]